MKYVGLIVHIKIIYYQTKLLFSVFCVSIADPKVSFLVSNIYY